MKRVPWSLPIRKVRSAVAHADLFLTTLRTKFASMGDPAIKRGPGCQFGRGITLRATDGGSITLGTGVSVADFAQIIACEGHIRIDDRVFIGSGTIIVSRGAIEIGRDSLIAEYTVVRDQDHDVSTRPLSQSGFKVGRVTIGRDVWVGCKASILRGASVGDRCVIGAHALVRSHIPDAMLAVGIPARAVRAA